ncbi:ABC transporter permease [Brevibacillus sp. SYSU BS000544]|uniref:ABC transporter permease n=1 Tax=Brevibacillus sp. SYSU BS000544 TaxID=3416443 RepID=UPI003CE495F6
MNGKHISIIFRKECIDLLRDRKTWIGAFVIPLFVIPLVFFLLGSSIQNVEKEAKAYVPIMIKGDVSHPLAKRLLSIPNAKSITAENPELALQAAEIRAIIEIPQNLESSITSKQSVNIPIWYDPSNQKSEYALGVIEDVIEKYESEIVAKRLTSVGLSTEAIQPLKTQMTSVASEEKMSGSILATIIPLMLMLSLASGGIPAATDLVAGERERGTLESLVSSPVAGGSILFAKLLTTMIMSIISASASLVSLSIVLSTAGFGAAEAKLSLGFLQPLSVGVLFLMIMLLSAMFAGLELSISSFARSFKEAQTYMTPIAILAVVPSYMLMPVNPVDIPVFYYLLPVFNGAAIFKEIFYGDLLLGHFLMAAGSSALYVGAAIWIASYFFRKEGVIVR